MKYNKGAHMAQAEKMKLTSLDIAAEKREQLRQVLKELLPEAANQHGIDFDQLKRALGEWVEPGKERFGLQWPGKADCMKVIQQPSVATLKPAIDESVNFDTTKNLFIEGDNLEVLKLLQKSYFGKVKMIYIDPPYNTGKEFIYPDKFAETLDTYLEYTGQKDSDGRKFSTNSETDGRYHSRWLNMMFPRLYLAKNLMRDDGVIFISIDDHEQANLKLLADLVFGEENFVNNIIWQKKYAPSNDAKWLSDNHDFIICYAKNKEVWRPNLLERSEQGRGRYTNRDNDPRGDWKAGDLSVKSYSAKTDYPITTPSGRIVNPPASACWRVSREKFDELVKDNRIWFGDDGNNVPAIKRFISEVKSGVTPLTLWTHEEVGHNQDAKKEIKKLFEDTESSIFDTPKPISLLKRILEIGADEDSIVMDFFAGSASLAHAVMEKNSDDGGSRKCISVQLPEKIEGENSSIADLAKERIRRAAKKITAERDKQLDLNGGESLDLGFKVFKLDRSNFKVWEGSVEQIQNLEQQLSLHVEHIAKAATSDDILYELLLKSGFPLTTKVEKLNIAGKEVYSIEEGALLICLEKELTQALIDALAETNPLQVICLDEGFKGNDQLKANAVQTFKARAQAEESEIVFKTV
jgi:adenine-specific DNA-methyltransferase